MSNTRHYTENGTATALASTYQKEGVITRETGGLVDRFKINDGKVIYSSTPFLKPQIRVATAVAMTTAGQTIVGVTNTDAARTITLASKDALMSDHEVLVLDESGAAATHNITIATEGSETINGSATLVISVNYGYAKIYSNGTNWFIAEIHPELRSDNIKVLTRTAHIVAGTTTGEDIAAVTNTDAARTITLATASVAVGYRILVKDESGAAGTNAITIATEGAETIDGANTKTINTNYGYYEVYCDGTNWFTNVVGPLEARTAVRTTYAVAGTTAGEDIAAVTNTDAGRTITLATVDVSEGFIITVKDESGGAGTHNITVATEAAETIDGAATFVISVNYGYASFYCDGTNWFVIDEDPILRATEIKVLNRVIYATGATTVGEDVAAVTNTDAARAIVLATASVAAGYEIIVMDESGAANINNITVSTEGAELISGAATVVIAVAYGWVRVYSNGTNWFVAGKLIA